MKFKKFIHIKDFFYHIFSKKEYEMDVFINSYSLNAVSEYINAGYVLTKNQDEKLKEILSANILYESHMENLINKDLPEKYKYFVLVEKFIKVFKETDNSFTNLPNTEQWLLKQTHQQITQHLMTNWKESFQSVIKSKNQQEIDKKIQQIKDLDNYLVLLNQSEKQEIIDFINQQSKNYSKILFKDKYNIKDDLDNLASYLENLQTKTVHVNSLGEIIKTLKEQGEIEIVSKLEITEEQYKTLFLEFKDMDKNKRNALMDLYNKHLISGLKQYIDIKPKIRTKNIANKNAQSLILQSIEEIKDIFDVEVKIVQEQKLMTLSSKSEYLSQLKKQW